MMSVNVEKETLLALHSATICEEGQEKGLNMTSLLPNLSYSKIPASHQSRKY